MSSRIEKHIWGLFAGRCAMCRESVIHDGPQKVRSLVGEVAHIVGERPGSARWNDPLPQAERNEPSNLLLLCRKHHKIVDDNESTYPADGLREVRTAYLAWLRNQLETTIPWRLAISAFAYLNLPRINEYAALQGFKVQHPGPAAGQLLCEMGLGLVQLMEAYRATLENLEIASIKAERVAFAHEDYIGQILSFDRLGFRTKNVPKTRPKTRDPYHFTGDFNRDPHIRHAFKAWTLFLNIDPRWITTSTAYGLFRPTSGQSLFTGFARVTGVNFDVGSVTATALALGQPMPMVDIFGEHPSRVGDVDFAALEDPATRARNCAWSGELERCDICGKSFADEPYMIDGPVELGGPWGCMCAACYSKTQLPLGVGRGQLYKRETDRWRLVGGSASRDLEVE